MLYLQAAAGGFDPMFLIVMLLMFGVMWFFIIRPQQKKQKEVREMRKTLQKGDRVITQGGIYGKIVDVKENGFVLEIAENVKIKIVKDYVYKDLGDMPQQPR